MKQGAKDVYKRQLVKCHLYNYGCIFVETILGVTDVMEIEEVEYLDDVIKSEIVNNQGTY